MKIIGRVQAIIFGITGYLILLVQQIPGIWIWVPLMAAPVLLILGALGANLPTGIIEAYGSLFNFNEVFFGKILIILSIVLIIYSIVYLGIKKRKGLVTSGPYRFVRHPQYTAFLLLTIGFTGWSYFYITAFFGMSWLSAEETIALWYLELLAYIILAFIEEKYLLKQFGTDYENYKNNTPLFVPFLKMGKFDIVISIVVFSLLLYVVIQFPLL
ncbi:MAG: isoprenylcysteine carboxylmethyltransferase family protein [bacterium]|nr:MAG: isoprenylcysteine carboxylmethyltransferase family protein [bacterium]